MKGDKWEGGSLQQRLIHSKNTLTLQTWGFPGVIRYTGLFMVIPTGMDKFSKGGRQEGKIIKF